MLGFRIYINNTEIDLKDNFPLSFNAQINDIREPDKRTATHSKTITIPASKTNVDLFTFIYDLHGVVDTSGVVNFVPDFNPNLKAECIALFDGVEVFRGIAQLTEIHVTDNDQIEFDIVLLGQLVNLYDKIADNELADLDFSEYNHDYTTANVEGSWSNSSGYCYPMIDYGNSPNINNFALNNMYPAIFVKQYIDKIFSDAGCTYTSDFFDTDFFQSLIIPFNGSAFKINSDEVLDRKFRVSRATTDLEYTVTQTATASIIVYNDESTAPNFDTSAQYDNATGFYVVGTGLQGTFNFSCFSDITARYVPDTSGVAVNALRVLVASLSFVHLDASNNVISVLNTYQVRIRPNGGYPITTDYETTSAYSVSNTDYIGLTGQVYVQSGQVTLNEGEKVVVSLSYYHTGHPAMGGGGTQYTTNKKFMDSGGTIYNGTYYVQMNVGSYFLNEVADANYIEGLPINMNNAIPVGIKQKDFLNGIIKMFNLYLEQDKDVSNNFIIEPRDDYYYDTIGTGTWMDLSGKLDVSQALDIQPMGSLDAKKYIFKYKEDKDYFNQDYLKRWGETYSERQVDIVNDFIKSEKKTEVMFSPTPSVGSAATDRVIPRILNLDIQSGSVSPITSNLRILIYSGLKDTNQAWTITDSAGLHNYTQYPYCGMLDDPYSPTVSLDWEVPDEIYWTNGFGTITYTNKNLYNVYYKKFIDEITDRNSKIVTGWFDIRPFDYAELDFRKIYYFEREYFRLNRVIGYNPISDNLTQLEFVKIQRGVDTTYSYDVADNVPTFDGKPAFFPSIMRGNNVTPKGTVLISGERNRVGDSVKSCVISGDENIVGEWCQFINVTGKGNYIAGDSSGVVIIGDGNAVLGNNITLINTYNKTINQNGSTYVNGRAVSGDASVEFVTASKSITTSGDNDATVYICDTTTGNITFTLPAAADYGVGNKMTVIKTDSSTYDVILDADGSELINDASTYTITQQYDYITIISDGFNWWIVSDTSSSGTGNNNSDYNNNFLLMGA